MGSCAHRVGFETLEMRGQCPRSVVQLTRKAKPSGLFARLHSDM